MWQIYSRRNQCLVALTAQLSDKGEVVIRMSARVSQARVLAGDLLTDHTHLLLVYIDRLTRKR